MSAADPAEPSGVDSGRQREREVDAHIAAGRMTVHDSTEEFLDHLDALLPELSPDQARRREAQYRALLETSVDDEELEDPEIAEARYRRVRAEVAAERRARGSRTQ